MAKEADDQAAGSMNSASSEQADAKSSAQSSKSSQSSSSSSASATAAAEGASEGSAEETSAEKTQADGQNQIAARLQEDARKEDVGSSSLSSQTNAKDAKAPMSQVKSNMEK